MNKRFDIELRDEPYNTLVQLGPWENVLEAISGVLHALENHPESFSRVLPLTNFGTIKSKLFIPENGEPIPALRIHFQILNEDHIVRIHRIESIGFGDLDAE